MADENVEYEDTTLQHIFYAVATLGIIAIVYKIYSKPFHLPWPQQATVLASAQPIGSGSTDAVSTTTVSAGTVTTPVTTTTTTTTGAVQFVVDSSLNFNFNGVTGNLGTCAIPTSFGGNAGVPGFVVTGATGGAYGVQILDGSGNIVRTVSVTGAGSY